MKKTMVILLLAMLYGCGDPHTEQQGGAVKVYGPAERGVVQ